MSASPVISTALDTLTQRRRAEEFAAALDGGRSGTGVDASHRDNFRRDNFDRDAALVVLARGLQRGPVPASTAFRRELRDRLVLAAAERTARPPVEPARVPRAAIELSFSGPHAARQRVVAAVTAVSLIGAVGATVASRNALPGEPLYGLKRGIESAQLSLARSDVSRGRELLEQAQSRLDEAQTLAASRSARTPITSARISAALAAVEADTSEGAKTLLGSYSATGASEPLSLLSHFVHGQRARLRTLSIDIRPDLRPDVTRMSRVLDGLQAQVDAVHDDTKLVSQTAPAPINPPINPAPTSPGPISPDPASDALKPQLGAAGPAGNSAAAGAKTAPAPLPGLDAGAGPASGLSVVGPPAGAPATPGAVVPTAPATAPPAPLAATAPPALTPVQPPAVAAPPAVVVPAAPPPPDTTVPVAPPAPAPVASPVDVPPPVATAPPVAAQPASTTAAAAPDAGAVTTVQGATDSSSPPQLAGSTQVFDAAGNLLDPLAALLSNGALAATPTAAGSDPGAPPAPTPCSPSPPSTVC